jgi:beta-phosphoglucomutase family hydrolase
MQNMPDRHGLSNMKLHESFEGLIFDCDGTLADTMPLHFVAWQDVLTDYGLQFDEDMFYSFAGQPTVSIVSKLLRQQNLDGDAVKIASEKEQAFVENLTSVKPIEPVVAVARHYRKSKPMGVGSGSNREVVFQILEHIGLSEFFDAVVGAEDTTLHKPEPDVFIEVARRIGVEPSACEVFEDADLGVEAAKRAGMAVFDVRTVHQPRRMTDKI